MGRKKKNQYPLILCGTFFPKDYLEELKKEVLEEIDEQMTLVDFLKEFIGSFDFSDFQHIKNVLVIGSELFTVHDPDLPEGYYIGVDFLTIPEQFSQKRAKIDIRKVFEDTGLLSEDDDPDSVQIFPKIISL